MRRVARAVLVYIDAAEATTAEESEEAREQGDQDDQVDQDGPDDQRGQAQTQEHFMDFDPFFVYYTVMTGSQDQKLDLSIWIDIHTHIYVQSVYLQMFCTCLLYIFYVKCVKCQSKI